MAYLLFECIFFIIKMGFIYRNYNIVMISILATIFNGTEQVF